MGMNQITLGLDPLHKKTRKEVFLEEMNKVVPWQALVALIQPHARGAHQALGGRPPFAVETMLRIHCLQLWWNLSDPAMEEELHERPLYRRFVGLDGAARLPDESTILRFRHLLEKHQLAPQVLATINAGLAHQGLLLKTGTVVDATIIAAPSSTKNSSGERDPEMHQTKKGNQWHFGMKAHIGVDSHWGVAHSAVVTAANVHDKHPLPDLLHGDELKVYGDSAYARQEELIASKAPAAKDCTNQRVRKVNGVADEIERARNRKKSKVRARVEHVFAVIKRQWGFSKVRYRGLHKNATRAFTMLALANIYMSRGLLLAKVRP